MVFDKGVSLPYDKLYNVVCNNPHGFGLILRDPNQKRLQVIRKCPENGTDPKELFKLLEDNKDIERYLHVRWRTDGPIDMDNTHPFTAYHSDARQVYFMHNGVLGDFKPSSKRTTWEGNVKIEHPGEDEKTSDSKKFNDEFLAPFLLTAKGANGIADVNDPMVQKIIEKFWNSKVSKGLLVTNDLDPVLINANDWKELDFGHGKFMSSNDTYFHNLQRGPVFEEEKKRKEAEAAKARQSFQSRGPHSPVFGRNGGGALTDLKDLNLKAREIKSQELDNIFSDFNIWSEEGMASLDQLTAFEFQALVERAPEEAVNLLLTLTSYYADLHKKYKSLTKIVEDLHKKKGNHKEKVG
jgi:hypothetical protein